MLRTLTLVFVVVTLVTVALVLLATVTLSPPSRATVPSISSVAVANITINGYPGGIAVNPNTNRIYVSDLFNNTLTVVDASTYAVIDTIVLPGTSTSGLVVDTRSNMVYVPVSGCTNEENVARSCDSSVGSTLQGGIVEINGSTNTIVGEFPIEVDSLIADPSNQMLYGVTGNLNSGSNSNSSGFLLAIDSQTGSVIANTSLGAYPVSLAGDPDTNMVYVAACKQLSLPCIGAEVLSVNETKYEVQSVVPLNFDALNFNVAVDLATNTVYAMGEGSNLVLVSIDGATSAIKYLAAIGGSCAGAGGGVLTLNTLSDEVVASFNSQPFLLFIDGPSGGIVSMVNATGGVQSVAFNSGDGQVYAIMEAQRENVGYLMVLPGTMSRNEVDRGLLPGGICIP